ncbi:unnamed protein product [Boreogadus saida]
MSHNRKGLGLDCHVDRPDQVTVSMDQRRENDRKRNGEPVERQNVSPERDVNTSRHPHRADLKEKRVFHRWRRVSVRALASGVRTSGRCRPQRQVMRPSPGEGRPQVRAGPA